MRTLISVVLKLIIAGLSGAVFASFVSSEYTLSILAASIGGQLGVFAFEYLIAYIEGS